MGEEQYDDTDTKQSPQLILGSGGDVETCEQKDRQRRDQDCSPKETVLFAEDRVDKVGVNDSAREVAEFIEGVGSLESLAPETGAADRIERLVDGPACTLRIKGWIKEDGETVLLVLLHPEEEHQRQGDECHQHEDEQVAFLDARDEEHGKENRQPDEGSSEVGLDQDEHAGDGRDAETDQDPQGRIHCFGVAQKEREEHDAPEDRELGGLEVSEAEVQPAPGSKDLHPDEEDQDQEDDAQQVHRQSAEADPLVVVESDEKENGNADQHPLDLAGPEGCVAHPSGAVDRVNAEEAEPQHDD